MCLIALDWRPNEHKSLILAANRDEFYGRPSESARYWKDQPHIYGGRDLLLGGTWLGCSTTGRLATVTNYFRKEDIEKKYPKSRGEIITKFCSSKLPAKTFAQKLEEFKDEYSGFSALLFDGRNLVCCSNRDPDQFTQELPEGTYGLSNHLLDTSWPKVEKVKQSLSKVTRHMAQDHLVEILLKEMADTVRVCEKSFLPTTLGEEEERVRSSVFVKGTEFGTRTTTIVTFDDRSGFDFTEKNHKTPFSGPSCSNEKIPCKK